MLEANHKSRFAHSIAGLSLLAMTVFGAPSAGAQEDSTGVPPPLQWPTAVSANPAGGLLYEFGAALGLRHSIEEAADLVLCKILMKDAKMPIPDESMFAYKDCPQSIKAKIDAQDGKVAWADGARPTQCGRDCLGGPFMVQTQSVDKPNVRYAMANGHLTFEVDVPGPFNRDVYYSYEIQITCQIPAGARAGTAKVTTSVNQPVVGDPGTLESIVDLVALPADLSRRITQGVQSQAGGGSTNTANPDNNACTSIGSSNEPPDQTKFDKFLWDFPPKRVVPVGLTVADTALKPTVTIYFDRIIRNHVIDGNPPAGPFAFTLYINGIAARIPKNDAIDLSPSGATYAQKFCKTLPMDGVDRLQILFVDNVGGSVWSQFTPAESFGSGGPHKMTTGRQFLTRGPVPRPGDKPYLVVVREFELDYRIDYHDAPTFSPVTSTTGGGNASPTGGNIVVRVPDRVLAEPDRPQSDSSCIKI